MLATVSSARKRIPHLGHLPGFFDLTSGCIGQTYCAASRLIWPVCAVVVSLNPANAKATHKTINPILVRFVMMLSSNSRLNSPDEAFSIYKLVALACQA